MMAKQIGDRPDYESVIDSVLTKTKKGKVDWEMTDKPTRFKASIGESIIFEIFLYVSREEVPEAAHILRMFGEDDTQVFAVSTTTIDLDLEYRDKLSDLYGLAERSARQIDSTIDEALGLLKKAK